MEKDVFRFCRTVDFPLYERDGETGEIGFSHNPFSMPQGGMEALENRDPLDILAWQYDIVCNGVELSSGAIRNHRPDIVVKAFGIAGYAPGEVEARFGAMLRAFRYGAPPHGGIAPRVDRILIARLRELHIRRAPAAAGADRGAVRGSLQRLRAQIRLEQGNSHAGHIDREPCNPELGSSRSGNRHIIRSISVRDDKDRVQCGKSHIVFGRLPDLPCTGVAVS